MYPALFEIGSIAVSSLWVCVALAFFVTASSFIKFAVRNKLKVAFITEHFFQILIYGLIGARIIYVAFNHQDYFTDISLATPISLISFWDKGLSFWGGVLGVVFAIYRYCKKEKESFQKWMDMLFLSLLAGLIFGNIGAFLEGINYGKETSLPWGMAFQNFNIPYTLPIHPSQLYATLYTTILFIAFLTLFLKEKFKEPGEMGLWIGLSYGIMRFLEEFTRVEETAMFLDLRMDQWIALTGIIIAGVFLTMRYNKNQISNPDNNVHS